MAERLKAHAWKVCIRQKRIEGSNPSPSATNSAQAIDLLGLFHFPKVPSPQFAPHF
ncbi:protein of unknown function [Azospirillum lipoferum 4B]|uniref:Uncharacterized protein n=1 Tax=Azospirillum lipoferum (strain 4B) TaxID=862719 RepID=G7Z253_AZOL4|nr:protein of unknown function [Azospirillum lipoferum 4B]